MANAAAIDAFQEYDLLVGEADGGAPLPQQEFDKLKATAERIRRDGTRLFVHWKSSNGCDCHAVGPATRCFCGHAYKSHAWFEVETRRVRCRVPGCRCACFAYVPGRGSRFVRCGCKHEHEAHRGKDGRPAPCALCGCRGYAPTWRCACGEEWANHRTVFESKAERAAAGHPTENLGGWGDARPHLDAATGGVTRMSSLLHGVERGAAAPLPHTDGAAAAARGALPPPPGVPVAPALPGTNATMAVAFDEAADAAVARLRIRDAAAGAAAAAFPGAPRRLTAGSAAAPPRPAPGGRARAPAAPPVRGSGAAAGTAAPPRAPARPIINGPRAAPAGAPARPSGGAAGARLGGGRTGGGVPPPRATLSARRRLAADAAERRAEVTEPPF